VNFILKMIKTFGWESLAECFASLSPSVKYAGISGFTITLSGISSMILRIFGIDSLAFAALFLVFAFELVTGIVRAQRVKERFSSMKLSRFTFKVTYYLVIIAIAYLMQVSFASQGNDLAADIFHWMHVFFVVQIVLENIVSISENIAVITGKEKAHWISKLQEKINGFFK
jgi:phage-related holin